MLAIGLTLTAIAIGVIAGVLMKIYGISECPIPVACIITGFLAYIFLGGDVE